MRHISDRDLFLALDLDRPGLAEVAAAVAAGDWDAAAAAWRRYFAGRAAPTPWQNLASWAAAVAGAEAERAVIAQADALIDRRVDFTDQAHGKSGLYGFHYLGWLAPLVRAYACSGDARYPAAWARFFDRWHATRDQVRGDWPGLDVIWYTLGVAIRSDGITLALHAFRDSPALPPATALAMLKTILGGARWLHEEHDAFRHGNWQLAGCAELLHLAGCFPEFREAGAWAATARARLEEHLELDVYPDGGHYERSPGYHTMCLGALCKAAVVGEQALGWRLAEHPRFAAMHDWLLALTTGAGWTPPFNDSPVVWSGPHLLWSHYFRERPEHKWLARRAMAPEELRAALGALPARPGRDDPAAAFAAAPERPPAAGSRLLPTSKYAVLRAGWGRDDLYAAINYGPFVGHELEPHSHLAGLDFVLAGWGEALAWEAGGPETYDDPRYYDWYRATGAHNTVVAPGLHTGEDRDAELLLFAALPTVDIFRARHLGDGGATHTRTLLFVRPGRGGAPYWFVHDQVTGTGPCEWALHGRTPWLAGAGRSCRSAEGPGLLVLPADPERIAAVAFDSGPSRFPDPVARAMRRGPVHALRYRQEGGEFAVALAPFAADAPAATIARDGDDLVIHLAGAVDRIGAGRWVRERDGRLVAAASWDTARLEHAGRLLAAGRGLAACGLTWTDGRLVVAAETTVRTALALWAPGAAAARLNGIAVAPDRDGDLLRVQIPCAGRYTVEIDLGGGA